MIRFPGDWVQHFGVNIATALPPQLGARFRFYERIRPQPSFSAIVQQLVTSDPYFVIHELRDVERIVTTEGEYGASVVIEGLREGRPARRFISAVFMHEFASALDCVAVLPQHFSRVKQFASELARSVSFQMTARPRVYLYQPPVGWQAIASGTTASWYPPDFPNNLTNLVVLPAVEHATGLEHAAEMALVELRGGLDVGADARYEIASLAGHKGIGLHVHGHRAGRQETLHRELAVFVVGTRVYRFRLESANTDKLEELRAVFRATAASFQPLPDADEQRRGTAFERSSAAFDHWGD